MSIIILFIFGFVAYASFSEVREARKNFEDFVEFFQDLVKDGKDFDGEKPLYVHKDYVIVGFSGKDIDLQGDCYGWIIGDDDKNLKIKKPEFCGDGGCLCLCDYKDSIVVDKEVIKERYGGLEENGEVVFVGLTPMKKNRFGVKSKINTNEYIFSTKDICRGKKDWCIKGGIESLSFSDSWNSRCGFFFIPGIIKKEGGFVERGIDEVNIIKEGNNVYILSEPFRESNDFT
jgi:hypothetical protein